ncbi:RICIN domain-containing protein [Actinosynnema pretiosum]|uniref:Ricin B lectin domain-containing protein n=1 Tax=Actinosynnema pretiosum TaxID=42197 RepID=A0A290Z8X0_9PSEU|nr:SdrD B-like domain-containing protein [Actinosynnema pretiosum]ATE55413.1 hypothetical protein CNX65_20755 [Actinosynnema pretiosum]
MRRLAAVVCALALLPLGAMTAQAQADPADRSPGVERQKVPPKRSGVPYKAASGSAAVSQNTVSGLVWVDANGDGVRSNTEVAARLEVFLWTFDDTEGWMFRTTFSDKGFYSFTDLPADKYLVQVVIPDGYRATAFGAGGDRSRDSDVVGYSADSTPLTFTDVGPRTRWVDAGITPGEPTGTPVRNSSSGWCLDQESPSGVATSGVGAYGCNGGLNQHWFLVWYRPDVAEVWNTAPPVDCLDQESPSGVPTNGVGAYQCNDGQNQRWVVRHDEETGSEEVQFVNLSSGDCLDQEAPRGTPTTGVGAYGCNGGRNQRWTLG